MGFLKRLFGKRDEPADDGDWVTFRAERAGAPASVLVDKEWGDGGPGAGLPVCVEVSVVMATADESGIPDGAELQAMGPLEDALIDALGEAGCVHVGTITTRGRRTWVLYAAKPDVGPTIKSVFGRFRQYAPQARAVNDPEWKRYRQLYPDASEERQALDMQVLYALIQQGDRGERERPIDHWAYFPTDDAARRFAGWAKSEGFTIEQMITPEKAGDRFGVKFIHVGPATPEISERTVPCAAKAAELGGDYDGWGTGVVRG